MPDTKNLRVYEKDETRGRIIRSVAGDGSTEEIRLRRGKRELLGAMGKFLCPDVVVIT